MKATLEFKLPEEDCEFKTASNAMHWALAVSEIDRELRNKIKYGHEFKTPEEALQWCRDLLNSILEMSNLSLDMLEQSANDTECHLLHLANGRSPI